MVLSRLHTVRLEQKDTDRIEAMRSKLSAIPGITTSTGDVIRACVLAGIPMVEYSVQHFSKGATPQPSVTNQRSVTKIPIETIPMPKLKRSRAKKGGGA